MAVADVQITVKDTCLCSGIIHYPKITLCSDHDSIHLEATVGYIAYEWSNNSHDRLMWAFAMHRVSWSTLKSIHSEFHLQQ